MFENLGSQPADALLALIKSFGSDQREQKIDLGVGVYRDERGVTPVMRAVKIAERVLTDSQATKCYLGPEGDERFVDLIGAVAFGVPLASFAGRLCGVQTPGGGGALRLGAELIAAARPGARVWVGLPTWPNHHPIFNAVRLTIAEYRYFDPQTQSVCFDEMIGALSSAQPGDVVLLHGCCHNPSGAELEQEQWRTLTALIMERRLVPFVDLAYQGLGQGLNADADATRRLLAQLDEVLVAYSCDKNFGLYRERTGALFALSRDRHTTDIVRANLAALARVNWSMPPDHGAAVARMVLECPEMSETWVGELEAMRQRINSVRRSVAATDARLAFLGRQRGMFSQLRIAPVAIAALRRDYGIYMADSGRINLAGLRAADAGTFVAALNAVGYLPSARTRGFAAAR